MQKKSCQWEMAQRRPRKTSRFTARTGAGISKVTLCFQEHNLDWFPRMRAMSLVSSDADGEQNEIRSLQEKLESTMKLVSNLSGQLTELKEQVGASWNSPRSELSQNLGGRLWENGDGTSCLFAVCWPLDEELAKCKSRWVIVPSERRYLILFVTERQLILPGLHFLSDTNHSRKPKRNSSITIVFFSE